MTEIKPKLKDNPRGALDHHITALQSESKMIRKEALVKINEEIFESKENSDCDLTTVFPDVYAYVLKSFSDPAEACRDSAALIISNFIDHLPLNDYYLTYILPVLVRRIGCPEIIEESEEIRLTLICLVHKILERYKGTQLLSPFINDFTNILTKTSTDPYPKVKLEACECIILVTKVMARDFLFQCESYVKPVLTNFCHQHSRVRVAAIRAIGAIVIAGNGKCFELSITPMAEKLFDENVQVRMQISQEVGNWMLIYRDRYSFWHRMIPLILTSMSDVMEEIRNTAAKLWEDIGLQFMDENEEDLKKKTDFLKDVPSHYPPDIKRPNLGCRTLVQRNIGKIVPAIWREMDGWHEDARLRCSQLLCWLLLCAEEGSTQHTTTIVRTLHRGAADDDPRVIAEIKRASELFGYFITPETWWPLLETEMDSWSALLVLANIIKGSKAELVKETAMLEICKELSDPERCRLRKPKYQTNLLLVMEALLDLCGPDCEPVFEQIFIINYTVYAMPYDDKVAFMALSNLDKLRYHEQCGKSLTSLYERHIRRVLADITSDALTWTLLTPDCCLLQCVLLHSSYAMGAQLHLIAPLLKECLATPKVDPEVKLKVFTTLSKVLLARQSNFKHCEKEKLEAFLKIVIEEVIMPNLVWSAGRTAEAIRTAAVACLCSAMQGDINDDKPVEEKGGDGDNNEKLASNSGDISELFERMRSFEERLQQASTTFASPEHTDLSELNQEFADFKSVILLVLSRLKNQIDQLSLGHGFEIFLRRIYADSETGDEKAMVLFMKDVNLFPTKESLEPFLDEMVPLLVGLVDDNSMLTRLHALRCICCLAVLARSRGCFSAELLHKIYFGVLKRLDDCSDKVRSFAVKTIVTLFKNRPLPYDTAVFNAHVDATYSAMLIHLDDSDEEFRKEMLGVLKRLDDCSDKVRSFAVKTIVTLFKNRPLPYDTAVFNAHVDATYSAMLIHLDDSDEEFRKEMLDALLSISDVDPPLLMRKVKANIHLYRNKSAYERLSSHLEKILKT